MKNKNSLVELNPQELEFPNFAEALREAEKNGNTMISLGLGLANTFEQKQFVWYGINKNNEVVAFPVFKGVTPPPLGGYFFAQFKSIPAQNYFMRKGTLYFYTLNRVILRYDVIYHIELAEIIQAICKLKGKISLICKKVGNERILAWEIASKNQTTYIPVFDCDKEIVISNSFEKLPVCIQLIEGYIFSKDGNTYEVCKDKKKNLFIQKR